MNLWAHRSSDLYSGAVRSWLRLWSLQVLESQFSALRPPWGGGGFNWTMPSRSHRRPSPLVSGRSCVEGSAVSVRSVVCVHFVTDNFSSPDLIFLIFWTVCKNPKKDVDVSWSFSHLIIKNPLAQSHPADFLTSSDQLFRSKAVQRGPGRPKLMSPKSSKNKFC